MSNQISTFDFKSNPVRVELFKNEPHFCLTDVCTALEISNATASRFRFNEKGLHKMYTLTKGGKQELTFINEPNLYRIIFRSNKSQAIEFQNWVFEEVLPQIRKTGQYSVQQQLALPEPKPEKKYTFELTERELRALVWLWCGHKQMNLLLAELEQPLEAIGSRFSGLVYSHHHEYKYQYEDCKDVIKTFTQPFKQSNDTDWTRARNLITRDSF